MGIKERTLEFIKYKGLKMVQFEQMCELSSGYVNSMRVGFGRDKLNKVLLQFPELSREWLLYGEGTMLKTQKNSEITQNVVQNNQNGDNIQGQQVTIQKDENDYLAIIKLQAEQLAKSQEQLSYSQEQLTRSQEQIDRLISIIEKR
jgi:hypothetical protein